MTDVILVTMISPAEHKGKMFYINDVYDRLHVQFVKIGLVMSRLVPSERGCTFKYVNMEELPKGVKHASKLPKAIKDIINQTSPSSTRRPKVYPCPYVAMSLETDEVRIYNTLRLTEPDGFHTSSVAYAISRGVGEYNGWVWVRKKEDETEESLRTRLTKLKTEYNENTHTVYHISIETGEIDKIRHIRDYAAKGFRPCSVRRMLGGGALMHKGHIFIKTNNEEEARKSLIASRARYKAWKQI